MKPGKHDKHIDLLVLTVNIQENISFGVPHVRTTVNQIPGRRWQNVIAAWMRVEIGKVKKPKIQNLPGGSKSQHELITDHVAKGARYHKLKDFKAAEQGIQMLLKMMHIDRYPTYPSKKVYRW